MTLLDVESSLLIDSGTYGLFRTASGKHHDRTPEGAAERLALLAPSTLAVPAGLPVGFGTQLGNGCTSGHGICGTSRLSPRSLVATGTFMLTGFATVFVVRHVLGGGQ